MHMICLSMPISVAQNVCIFYVAKKLPHLFRHPLCWRPRAYAPYPPLLVPMAIYLAAVLHAYRAMGSESQTRDLLKTVNVNTRLSTN